MNGNKNITIAYICDTNYLLDSRPQKEVNSLLNNGYNVSFIGWDRSQNGRLKKDTFSLNDNQLLITKICSKGKFGGSVKEMLFALIKYEFKLLYWLIKNRHKYDVIHACNFNTGYIANKCARLLKKKLIYDIYDFYVDSHPYTSKNKFIHNLIRNMDINVINKADTTIICSEKRKEQIKGASPKKLIVLHNTPPKYSVNVIENYTIKGNDKVKIAYVGSITCERPIRELADIVSKNSSLELHCGGFGPDAKYIEEIAERNNNIFFYGEMTYAATLYLESQCDILPALYDPKIANHQYAAPNKFYEALMLGKPLIMIKNTGMDDMVTKYDIGEVTENTIEGIENAILRLIDRRSEWDAIGSRMKLLYDEKFSWDEMERRLIALYDDID